MKRSSLLVVFTALILAGTLLASYSVANRKPYALARPLDSIPTVINGWNSSPGPIPGPRELELLGATSYLSRDYTRAGKNLNFFVAYYGIQRAGETMHTPKNCLPAAGWEILKYDEAEVPLEGRTERINKFTIQNGDAKALVLYWYQTKDRVIANEYKGKGLMLWDSMTKGRTDGAMLRIVAEDNPQATHDALEFARVILAEIKRSFGP